jgi:hypothetical protein
MGSELCAPGSQKQRLLTRQSDTLSYSIIFNLALALTRSMVSRPSLKNP